MRRLSLFGAVASATVVLASIAYAQQQGAPPPPAPPFGTPITLDQAKKVAAAAEAEAKKNNLNSAFAIVEPTGALVYFAQNGRQPIRRSECGDGQSHVGRTLSPPDRGFRCGPQSWQYLSDDSARHERSARRYPDRR